MQGCYIQPIQLQARYITTTAATAAAILPFLLKFFQISIYPPSI